MAIKGEAARFLVTLSARTRHGCIVSMSVSAQILDQINIARKEKGLTLQCIAERIGTTESTISRILSGKQCLTVEWLDRIATVLDVIPALVATAGTDAQVTPHSNIDLRLQPIVEQLADIRLLAVLIEQLAGHKPAPHESDTLRLAAVKMTATVLALESAVLALRNVP